MNKGKRGQIAVFIILGVLIVGGALLYFLLRNGSQDKEPPLINEETDVDSFLEVCMQERVYDVKDVLLEQGGYMENPLNVTYGFGEDNLPIDVSYLCYTGEYYSPCVDQEGSVLRRMEIEFEDELLEDLKYCLDDLEESFDKKGYNVKRESNEKFEFNLVEDKLKINITSTFILEKAEETTIHNGFELEFPTKLYNLGKVANRIVSYETKYSSFDFTSFMKLYPEYNIWINEASDQSKIYSVEDLGSGEILRFAIRGGVLPL